MGQAQQASTVPFAIATLGIATFSTMDALMRSATLVIGAYNAVFWRTLIMIPLAGVIYLVSRAYQRAEAQLLANTEHTALIWAMMYDTLLFDKPIRLTTIGGAMLIVSGCLLAARPGRQPLSPAEAPL